MNIIKSLLKALFLLLIINCKGRYSIDDPSETYTNNKVIKEYPNHNGDSEMLFNEGMKKIHALIDTNGNRIGNIHAHLIEDSIFSSLFVIHSNDTIYKIIENRFYNSEGLDEEV